LADFSEQQPESNEHFQMEIRQRYEEALQRSCLITRLNEATSLIGKAPEVCIGIVNILLEFTSAENCSIMLNDPATASLNIVVAKGRNDSGSFYGLGDLSTTVFARGEGAAGWVAQNAEMLSIADCDADSRFIKREAAVKEIRSVICAPVIAEGKVLGVINCSHPKKQRFSELDEHNVSLIAGHTGILLQQTLLADQLREKYLNAQEQAKNEERRAQDLKKQFNEVREQLYKSEKFATLGELLAGVAHELNNRIAPILIYSQMLAEKAKDDKDQKRLKIIEESAMGAKAILETLLHYSRTEAKEQGPVNLNQTLQNTLMLTEYKLKNHGIEPRLDLSPHLPPVIVNEKQIAQVFLNIINNAVSAMEAAGGQLRITSEYDRSAIRFRISDSGPGIAKEIAQKIFDPFFTTKESGKGTGLGLSISKRYLEEHRGKIYLDCSTNCGATFIIEIPRTDIRANAADEPDPGYILPADTESAARILVVEDDSTIRDVIRDILGSQYEIEFANDGQEATAKIESDLFDLLVVDYHMPGLDGKQLYEWISHNRPSLKRRVVFSTGDIFHDEIHSFIKGTGCHSLTKPFSTTDLRETVSGVLNG